jgi:hypothetical protein
MIAFRKYTKTVVEHLRSLGYIDIKYRIPSSGMVILPLRNGKLRDRCVFLDENHEANFKLDFRPLMKGDEWAFGVNSDPFDKALFESVLTSTHEKWKSTTPYLYTTDAEMLKLQADERYKKDVVEYREWTKESEYGRSFMLWMVRNKCSFIHIRNHGLYQFGPTNHLGLMKVPQFSHFSHILGHGSIHGDAVSYYFGCDGKIVMGKKSIFSFGFIKGSSVVLDENKLPF